KWDDHAHGSRRIGLRGGGGRGKAADCGCGCLQELAALHGVLSMTADCYSRSLFGYECPDGRLCTIIIKEYPMSIQRFGSSARLSQVVIHGDTVYLAGLTADKTVGQSVAAQTQEILAAIDALLAKAGTDKSKLLQATVWLQDIRTVDEMNKVWDAWGPAGTAPARACIAARLHAPAQMVEIRVTAGK